MFGFSLEKLFGYLAAGLALVLAVLGYGAAKKKQGATETKKDVKAKAQEEIREQINERQKVEQEVQRASTDDLDDKLRKHARRDD